MHVYREEIDGLRAVAIIPVILYHGGFLRFFSGGYVGVDIFFVISGYLITSIIVTECDRQTFSLVNFYERRCRRILPALFFIVFVSSLLAYHWMLPDQLLEFGQTLISMILLSSNFFFWWKDDGYFSRLTELNPLVHTWSLAVEEQFYFVFPLLCYFFNQKRRQLIAVLVFFALVSFFLAQWGGNLYSTGDEPEFQIFGQHPWASFYLPVGRIWELLFGAFAAFYLRTNNSLEKSNNKWKELVAILGLTLIIISVIYLDSQSIHPFPNCYTLLPTCGATLIILFGHKNTFVGFLLSKRPLRWIGLISYSAYLWHQPLFAFTRLRYSEKLSLFCVVSIISAVLLLSVFSYLLVEQPFRQKQTISQKYIFIGSAIGTILTLFLALFLMRTANTRSLLAETGTDSYLAELQQHGTLRYTLAAYDRNKPLRLFSNNTSDGRKKLALIGDSYSQDFLNIVTEGNYLTNYEIRPYYVHFGCQIYMGPEDRQKFILPQDKQRCLRGNHIRYALPIIRQADVIVLTALWLEWSAERLPNTIKYLRLKEEQKLIIIGSKHFGAVQPMLYANKSKEYRIKQYNYPPAFAFQANALLERIIDPSIFINLMKMLCNGTNNACALFTEDGKLISYDGTHLTKYGALHVGKMLFSIKPLSDL